MALLMDEGSDPITDNEKADLDAIAAIKESTARELKEEGNKYVKMGKKHYTEAVSCYTRAINQKALDDPDTSVLFANRAHANLLLKNYRRALDDAKEATRLCPTNVKAIYRAGKAAFHLGLLDEAALFCKNGIEQFPSNEELKKLAAQVDLRKKEKGDHDHEVSSALSIAKDLASALKTRGLKLGKAVYQELTGLQKFKLDKNNIIHWPVLLLYPEVMSSDFIEDFCETDMISAHLDVMYSGNSQALPWDTKGAYTRDAIELYYQAGSGIILSEKEVLKHLLQGTAAAFLDDIPNEEKDPKSCSEKQPLTKSSGKWFKVDEKKKLCDILQKEDYIIPGIPVFYVISRSSDFHKKFKRGDWNLP